ncbi:MAG: hypothetical protein RLZZ319_885 [Actinomycetota bacterium]
MTDEPRDDNADDVEWLKNAFDRANQGDNGTVSESPRPAPAPFDESSRRHDLDLDFETDNFQPVTEFTPVRIPPERPDSADDPKTEALDALEIPEPVAPTAEAPAKPRRAPRAPRAPKAEKPLTATDPAAAAAFRQQLLMVAGGIGVVILALGGFLVGKNVGTPAPAPVATPTAEPAPTAAREPGDWAFDQLFGGECITPFGGAWSENFTVVDCATEHEAQLVYAGDLQADGSYPSYPGDTHIGNAAMTLCQREGVLSLSAAKKYSDIVVSSAYPVSQAAWDSGDTRYYCFVSRTAGATIADDLAGSLVSAPAEAAPEPTTTP